MVTTKSQSESKANNSLIIAPISDKRKRFIAFTIIISMMSFVAIVLMYSYMAYEIEKYQNDHIMHHKERTFDQIESYINELYAQSGAAGHRVSSYIKTNIIQQYADVHDLQDEMANKNYDHLNDIIFTSVMRVGPYLNNVKTANNSIVVGTNTNIIYNLDYSISYNNTQNKYATWKNVIDNFYNKDLADNAYNEIVAMSRKMIFVEPEESEDENHIYYKTMNMDKLKSIYIDQGINGLKGYELLVPTYIDDTKDLFGTQEIKFGIKQETFRLIIVQRCNIYEQISKNKPDLLEDDHADKLLDEKNVNMIYTYILGILIVITFLSVLITSMTYFNNVIIGKKEQSINMIGNK